MTKHEWIVFANSQQRKLIIEIYNNITEIIYLIKYI